MKKLCIVLICVAASSLNGMNQSIVKQSDPFNSGYLETKPDSPPLTRSDVVTTNWSDTDSDIPDVVDSNPNNEKDHADWSDGASSPAFPHREHYGYAPSPPPYYSNGASAAFPAEPACGVARPYHATSSRAADSNDPWNAPTSFSCSSSTGHFGVESRLSQGVASMIPSAIRFIEYAPKVLFVGGVTAIGGLLALAAAQWFKKNNQSGHAHGDMTE